MGNKNKLVRRNLVDVYVKNELKLNDKHLQFQKIPGGDTLGLPLKGGGQKMGREKSEKGEGRGCVMAVGGWTPVPDPILPTDGLDPCPTPCGFESVRLRSAHTASWQ